MKLHTCLIVLFLESCISANTTDFALYKNYKMYKVEGKIDQIRPIQRFLPSDSVSFELRNDKFIGFPKVKPEMNYQFTRLLKEQNIEYELIHDDYSRILEAEYGHKSRLGGDMDWKAYYDVNAIHKWMEKIANQYPKLVTLVNAGNSFEGRKLLGVKISSETKNKQTVIIESGIHAREWIAPATATYFINQLVTNNAKDISFLRNKFEWYIFPSVNPDGYQYTHDNIKNRSWRKTRSHTSNPNCRGVDGNRNFPYKWGKGGSSNDPCYEDYHGEKAVSEVEVANLIAFVEKTKNLLGYFSFHSNLPGLLVPYSDSTAHLDNYDDLVKIGKIALSHTDTDENKYKGPGTAPELLYEVTGGSMDWVKYTTKANITYTFEFRGRDFHLPPQKIIKHGNEVTRILVSMFKEACKMGYC